MRRFPRVPWLFGLVLLVPSPARALLHPEAPFASGALVSVAIEVDGQPAPLYAAPDGSARHYVEARAGREYVLRLSNRTGERAGLAISVDGLNVISGERPASAAPQPSDPGRMYVLEAWDVTEVRGWRTSLQDVQRFVFVDERASYAARAGRANARMGWIELSVYRERYPRWPHALRAPGVAASPDAARDRAAEARDESLSKRPPTSQPPAAESGARSHPGTGWGPRADDPVRVVAFDPEPHPSERVTLRYEYRRALLALGIDLGDGTRHDRLWEREHGVDGFARPPEW